MLEIDKFSKIIVANWKMNGSIRFIDNFFENIEFKNVNNNSKCIVICPPYTYCHHIAKKHINYFIGSQDCSTFLEGAYTGDVSARMLRDIGCHFCIVGHSERRTNFRDSNVDVSIKAYNCIINNINPIICIGETLEQKKNKKTKSILSKQIQESISKKSSNKNTIIAYEPIWSIGSGITPSLSEIKDIHNFIKYEISGYENFKIIYGGSVKSANSMEILNLDGVDGVLVGGASLNIEEFNKIVTS